MDAKLLHSTKFFIALIPVLLSGCLFSSKNGTLATAVVNNERYLYVASGACYSPAAGAQNGNRLITRYKLDTGESEIFYDFNSDGSYDLPGGMVDLGDKVMVAINPYDNSTSNSKQIVFINKSSKAKSMFYQDANYLPAGTANTLRTIKRSSFDGNVYVSKSGGVEKIDFTSYFKLPNYSGTLSTPYFSGATTAMGSTTCLGVGAATASSLVYDMVETSSGKWIVSHAVSAQNKIAVLNKIGVNASTDCYSTQQGVPIVPTSPPTVAAAASTNIPTGLVLHSVSSKLLVAMSGTTSTNNSVIAYSYSDSTGVLSSPTVGFYGIGQLYQPTAMVEDTETGEVYVASYGQLSSGALGFIRKFKVDSTTGAMTDSGMFAQSPIATKCVSSMFVGE